MSFLRRIDRWLVPLQNWMGYISGAVIIVMMLVTCIDIAFRYAGRPFEGVFEGVEILLVIAVYMGLAEVQYNRKNVYVEILVERLSGKARIVAEVFDLLLPIIVFAVMIWVTGARAWESFLMRESTFMPAQHPIWVGRIALTIGIFFLWLRLVVQVSETFYNLTKRTGDSRETGSTVRFKLPGTARGSKN